jgi:hypothetical protein
MAQITIPRFFPQPWAANELMPPLTAEEMAIGYPSGTSEKPTRQSINNALQYAINGVLYYLTTGVPAWVIDAVYKVGSIVLFGGSYFRSTVDANVGQQPDSLNGWEQLPWRRSDLDALYMTQAQANARFLSPESGDLRYYTQTAANALFLTQANAAAQFVTKAALEADFLTTEQANLLFLTQAQADLRYALRTDVVTRTALNETLADYETRESAAATFMTPAQAEERFMTAEDAAEIFETQANARATFLALEDAGLRIFRFNETYRRGVLVLDTASGIIYQSVADDNTSNSLLDTEWWRPWLMTAPTITTSSFVNLIAFTTVGTFTVNASDIPMLAERPDGIYMRVVMKGSGGLGGGAQGAAATHGGGEGFTYEAVLQNITSEMFPISIEIAQGNVTGFQLSDHPTPANFAITVQPGGDGSNLVPGIGGNSKTIYNDQNYILSSRDIPGAYGKWGLPSLRGGDGGGVLGGSGAIDAVTYDTSAFEQGRRGCGGGGCNALGLFNGSGGPGFVEIYW